MTTPTTPEALRNTRCEAVVADLPCHAPSWKHPQVVKDRPEYDHEYQPCHPASPALRDAIALGVAWAAVEAVLPVGWCMSVESDADVDETDYVSLAGPNAQPHIGGVSAFGDSPKAALLALHAALLAREEGSR